MKSFHLLAVVVLALGGCHALPIPSDAAPPLYATDPQHIDDGRHFLETLSGTIRRADRIVISEHSNGVDAWDSHAGKSLVPDEVVYETRELSAEDTREFLAVVEDMNPGTMAGTWLCEPDPHHTIDFYTGPDRISRMDVCFTCGWIGWDATDAETPLAIYAGLAKVVERVGLHPHADWSALAKAHVH